MNLNKSFSLLAILSDILAVVLVKGSFSSLSPPHVILLNLLCFF